MATLSPILMRARVSSATNEKQGEGCAVWNHPIDVHFGTDSLAGWPRLLIEVCLDG